MVTKKQLHTIVDQLHEGELHTAMRFLEYLRDFVGDPLMQALITAPEDDEVEVSEETQGAEMAWQEYLQGKTRPWEDVRQELGSE